MRRLLLLTIVIFLPIFGSAEMVLDTVLDYSDSELKGTVVVPVSAFHDWHEPEAEAKIVAAAWKTEPAGLAWTRIQLSRHIKHKTMPTRGARGLALMHVAMHDAYKLAMANGANEALARLALSMAAAEVLGYLYVAEERAFVRIAFEIAAQTSGVKREQLSAQALSAFALGASVAQKIIQRAENDGAQRGWNGSRLQYYGQDRYYGPGSWEATPPYFYYPPDEPFAPSWQTWVLKSPSEFRPVPLEFGSAQYLEDLAEVIRVNQEILATATPPAVAASTNALAANQAAAAPIPTDARYEIAKFWVDGYGSVTPAGHWNQIAIAAVQQAQLGDVKTLELFAQLNIGLADTFVATWDAKYHYWTMRPITAAKKLLNIDLKPIILTPPFPSYPSGHAGFSACAAAILSHYFPDDAIKFNQMAEEAAMSRLYGGIHFRFDDDDGLTLGKKIAGETLSWFSNKRKAR